jgi:predicted dehydrogenase
MHSGEGGANRASNEFSRRDFLKTAAGASGAVLAGGLARNFAYAAGGSDKLRIGLVGCGGRGKGAVDNCLESAPNVELWAVGDLFQDKAESARRLFLGLPDKPAGTQPIGKLLSKITGTQPTQPAKKFRFIDKVKIEDRCYWGFDNCQKVIDSGVDIVLLTTPPGFRPIHMQAAIEANKHVFAEKPVAVDPAGVRSVIATSELAARKKLSIVAGTQSRHHALRIETVKRIHDGDIGDIVAGQCYYFTGGLWVVQRKPEMSDMEWQCRNWLYFTWLSGDHIVEQHVHNLDVMNWVMKAHPVNAIAMGGRQARTGPEYGNIFDHFAVEYEYPGGVRVTSMCRQTEKATTRIGENIVGTKGTANPAGSITGEKTWKFEGKAANPQVQEHTDLIEGIRKGEPLNEGLRIAESSMTAILGRMSAYTGRELGWNWAMNTSKLDLVPKEFNMGPLPVEPVAIPGKTPLI